MKEKNRDEEAREEMKDDERIKKREQELNEKK